MQYCATKSTRPMVQRQRCHIMSLCLVQQPLGGVVKAFGTQTWRKMMCKKVDNLVSFGLIIRVSSQNASVFDPTKIC